MVAAFAQSLSEAETNLRNKVTWISGGGRARASSSSTADIGGMPRQKPGRDDLNDADSQANNRVFVFLL